MALFHTTVVDNQIKALSTIGSVSGSIATFDTDRAERLVKCVCEVASGASEINVSACGVNIWNEDWGNYSWNTSGVRTTVPDCIGTYNYIKVLPNTPYYFVFPSNWTRLVIRELDENKSFVVTSLPDPSNRIITTNANTRYIVFNTWASDNIRTYDNNISINSNTDITTYNAYNGNTYNIQFGETLSDTATYDAISGVLTRNDSTTKQLDSCNIVALDNETNNVYCDTGDTEVNYIMTVGKAIS